jgi:general secretion pathway protein D
MDQSAVQETDVIALRYAVAEDVVRMLEKLNASEAKASGGEVDVLLVPDKRTNSVLVTGDELQRARIRKLIATSIRPWSRPATSRSSTSSTPRPRRSPRC